MNIGKIDYLYPQKTKDIDTDKMTFSAEIPLKVEDITRDEDEHFLGVKDYFYSFIDKGEIKAIKKVLNIIKEEKLNNENKIDFLKMKATYYFTIGEVTNHIKILKEVFKIKEEIIEEEKYMYIFIVFLDLILKNNKEAILAEDILKEIIFLENIGIKGIYHIFLELSESIKSMQEGKTNRDIINSKIDWNYLFSYIDKRAVQEKDKKYLLYRLKQEEKEIYVNNQDRLYNNDFYTELEMSMLPKYLQVSEEEAGNFSKRVKLSKSGDFSFFDYKTEEISEFYDFLINTSAAFYYFDLEDANKQTLTSAIDILKKSRIFKEDLFEDLERVTDDLSFLKDSLKSYLIGIDYIYLNLLNSGNREEIGRFSRVMINTDNKRFLLEHLNFPLLNEEAKDILITESLEYLIDIGETDTNKASIILGELNSGKSIYYYIDSISKLFFYDENPDTTIQYLRENPFKKYKDF